MTSPSELIQTRKSTHGEWCLQADMAHRLKSEMHFTRIPGAGWDNLTASQQEALDMIAVKISRILSGNPNEPDHWDDIAGYALLGKGGHPET